eukprot:jgi/Mesen1/2097/ME000151S01355
MAALALSQVGGATFVQNISTTIPSSSRASQSFVSFSGLSASKDCSAAKCNAIAVKQGSLVIEAKGVPRRERVATRHNRIRRKLTGTTERPRMAVFRSNQHLYVQVIDDSQSHTLASASTLQPSVRELVSITSGPTIEAAKKVGEVIAKACLEKGITKVAFDRGGFIYHGRISALADSARASGLEF